MESNDRKNYPHLMAEQRMTRPFNTPRLGPLARDMQHIMEPLTQAFPATLPAPPAAPKWELTQPARQPTPSKYIPLSDDKHLVATIRFETGFIIRILESYGALYFYAHEIAAILGMKNMNCLRNLTDMEVLSPDIRKEDGIKTYYYYDNKREVDLLLLTETGMYNLTMKYKNSAVGRRLRTYMYEVIRGVRLAIMPSAGQDTPQGAPNPAPTAPNAPNDDMMEAIVLPTEPSARLQ